MADEDRHFPSVEALSAKDDARLVAELELCRKHEELARLRALVDRADHLLVQVLACGPSAEVEVMPASRRS